MSKQVDMREYIKEQCELAITYAEDGAYMSAARVLYKIAQETHEHVLKVAAMFATDIDEH
jgi:KaiC/GvpD/RAD55 family RecA-like ATPase